MMNRGEALVQARGCVDKGLAVSSLVVRELLLYIHDLKTENQELKEAAQEHDKNLLGDDL